jgi:aldose 1-epimerase
MTITQEPFGSYQNQAINRYVLRNGNGLSAHLINFGACLTEMHVPDRYGALADIVLGFDNLSSYAETETYFGATCGRYGNRIKNGAFVLADSLVQLSKNEGTNHLHGGFVGFDKRVWMSYPDEDENSVTFTLHSKCGEEGYPGNVLVKSKYAMTADNHLIVEMTGLSDHSTIVNMVHHTYWNVGGHQSGNVLDHFLTVEADFYTPIDDQLLTTGEILAVADTPFDFREERPIGERLMAIDNKGAGRLTEEGGGYDHNWVIRGFSGDLRAVAVVRDPASGRGFALRSTEPGVQIYTGGYLNPSVVGKSSTPYCIFGGLTFETQKFPGSPNFSHFPSARLNPGEVYKHLMDFRFFAL